MQNPSQRHKPLERLDRYELLEALRDDGGRIVCKARDPLLARLVAIECVDPAGAPPARAAIERKARLAGGLAHPNIVAVYDAASRPDVAYIATEVVEGRTLRAVLDSDAALAPAAIERIAAQVADGLDFMHRHGIVHADIDPSSVIVLDIGFVKIAYSGNALFALGSAARVDGLRAPSPYTSPEQLTGGALDARSDVFGLGAVLYEMLTRSAPFAGNDPDELARAILSDHPRPPSAVNPAIPSGFDYIVARALSKQAEHRYQSASDMALHLRRWALEEPTFFAVPRASATSVTGTTPHAPARAPPVQSDEDADARNDDALPASQRATTRVRSRRAWLLYGIPAALLTVGTVCSLWRRPTPSLQTSAADVGVEPLTDARPSDPAPVAVRDTAPPATARDQAEPSASLAAPPAPTGMARVRAARVKLAVSPWGEIYVDGRKRGVSPPLRQIDLAPGKHTIEIRNTTFPAWRESIEMRPNTRHRIKYRFR